MKFIPVWSSQKQGRGRVIAHMKCDDRDFPLLSAIKWRGDTMGRTTYAMFTIDRDTHLAAHQLVAARRIRPYQPDEVTDHVNGDGLDNQLSNLRIVTHAINKLNVQGPYRNNTSGFRGVTWDRRHEYWVARATRGGKTYHAGSHETPEAANEAVVELRHRLGMAVAR